MNFVFMCKCSTCMVIGVKLAEYDPNFACSCDSQHFFESADSTLEGNK